MISAGFRKIIMTKTIAEQSHALSIFWLKKNKAFVSKELGGGMRIGSIKWTSGSYESSIGYTTNISEKENYIKLNYTHTSHLTGEKTDMDYKIELTNTSCNYGGKRYWFICPLSKNGQYCGRRVGVLYLIGKYYGCRHCGEIAYYSQMQTERYKGFVSIPDIEEAKKKVKRYYYKGKPTRKHRKLIRLNEKFELGFIKSMSKLDKRFANFKNSGKI